MDHIGSVSKYIQIFLLIVELIQYSLHHAKELCKKTLSLKVDKEKHFSDHLDEGNILQKV